MSRGILQRAVREMDTTAQRSRRGRRNQFLGAQVDRLIRLTAPNLSADRSMERDIHALVRNARDAARNNGYARRFIRMAKNNIAGPNGVRMRPVNMLRTDPGRPNDLVNDRIRAAWDEWSRPRYASTNRELSWLTIQRLAVSERFTPGEALIQLVTEPVSENKFGLSLQPIDADRLDRDYCRPPGRNPDGTHRNEIRYGVEIDRVGRRVAYHILRAHPTDTFRLGRGEPYRDRIPAEDIIHWYQRDDRVDLTRGIPPMAVALRDLAHIADAQDASLIALKVNAANNGFITATGDNVEPEDPPEDDIYMDGEPGQYKILPRGYRVESPDPNQPQDNFPDFVRAVLRASAVGLGTSYAFLASDWSDANFASMRLGRADEQDEWIALQNDFIETVCQRVYERWLVSAVLSGALVLPQFDVSLARAVQWQGRRWVSPKPLEDVEVYERRIALGIDSRAEIMAAEGRDLWPTWDHLAEEQEYAEDLGILVEPPRKATTATATPLPERPGEGDDASGTSTTTGTTTSGGRLRFQFAASPNGHPNGHPNGRAAHSNGNGAAHD